MLKLKFFIFLLLSILFAYSCETIVDVDLPELKPQLVVNGICKQDKYWGLNISSSKNILDENEKTGIGNAKIKILENGNPLPEFHHISNGTYKLNGIKPKVNVDYELTVSAENFTTVTAHCIIPEPVKITNVSLDIFQKEEYGAKEYTTSITFKDTPHKKNYYSLIILNVIGDDTLNASPVWFRSKEIIIENKEISPFEGGSDTFRGSEAYFTDEIIDGKEYTMVVTFDVWGKADEQKFIIVLNSLNEDYYKYLKTLKSQRETKDNPFAEPVIVYSNIKNGLGIFAGYSAYKYIIPESSLKNTVLN